MRRIIFFCTLILLSTILTACTKDSQVDLTNITCDGVRLGDNIESIGVNSYDISNRIKGKENTFDLSKWKITTDADDNITKIHANFRDIEITVNSKIYSDKIDDIINELGSNHSVKWYDREQQLKQAVYSDSDNHVQAKFVYNDYDNQLVWLIIETD